MDHHDDKILTGDFASKKLRAVLSGALTCLAPKKKMDALYFTNFESYNWDDKNFVDGYPLFMGSLLVLRVPLSASALECLLQCTDADLQTKEIALPLDPLLIGWPDEKAPIKLFASPLATFSLVRS